MALPFDSVPIQLTDVALLHACAHAELVCILLSEVEQNGEFWVVELVVRWKGELDCISLLIRVAVLPHEREHANVPNASRPDVDFSCCYEVMGNIKMIIKFNPTISEFKSR
jgi:hypothetical protein